MNPKELLDLIHGLTPDAKAALAEVLAPEPAADVEHIPPQGKRGTHGVSIAERKAIDARVDADMPLTEPHSTVYSALCTLGYAQIAEGWQPWVRDFELFREGADKQTLSELVAEGKLKQVAYTAKNGRAGMKYAATAQLPPRPERKAIVSTSNVAEQAAALRARAASRKVPAKPTAQRGHTIRATAPAVAIEKAS